MKMASNMLSQSFACLCDDLLFPFFVRKTSEFMADIF